MMFGQQCQLVLPDLNTNSPSISTIDRYEICNNIVELCSMFLATWKLIFYQEIKTETMDDTVKGGLIQFSEP